MKLLSALLAVAAFAFAPAALARTCALSIDSTDRMSFTAPTLTVARDCKEVVLTLNHTGRMPAQAMGHNWVLTRTADVAAVAQAGMRSSLANSYLAPGDARVIAHTSVVGGGQSTSVRFATSKLAAGGDYTFFCSFPGHSGVMRGKLVFG